MCEVGTARRPERGARSESRGIRTSELVRSGCCNKGTTNWEVHTTDIISHSSGGRKSEIKVSEGLVSPEASLFGV